MDRIEGWVDWVWERLPSFETTFAVAVCVGIVCVVAAFAISFYQQQITFGETVRCTMQDGKATVFEATDVRVISTTGGWQVHHRDGRTTQLSPSALCISEPTPMKPEAEAR